MQRLRSSMIGQKLGRQFGCIPRSKQGIIITIMQPNSPTPEQPTPIPKVNEGSVLERSSDQMVAAEIGSGELPGAISPAGPPLATSSLSATVPVSAPAQPSSDAVVPAPITSPLSADDSDLIEPQWVDAVDTIIETTANDPHQMEEDAEQLSRNYLKERFGIDVNSAS